MRGRPQDRHLPALRAHQGFPDRNEEGRARNELPGFRIHGIGQGEDQGPRRQVAESIIVYATGNNKISLDLMKAGKVHGIRWESAEADGALALETAIDYFNGLEVQPIRYLPAKVIRPEAVDSYYPAQW